MTATPRIPNIFHFVFGLREQREPFHLVFYLCLASCRTVNRPDAIYVHYHHRPYGHYWDLACEFVTPVPVEPNAFVADFRYADQGIEPYRYAHHADFIRLERLLEQGGVYADIDTIFVHPIPETLWRQPFVLGREGDVVAAPGQPPQPSLCNALIMAEPGAAFGRLWLAEMRRAFDGTWSAHSTLLPERLRQLHPELIHVEPERTFYAYPWTAEGIGRLLEGVETDWHGIASIHLWSHLWWQRGRRDFSNFHAGRMTERRIARVDTTYNLIARRHLPPPRSLGQRLGGRLREAVQSWRASA